MFAEAATPSFTSNLVAAYPVNSRRGSSIPAREALRAPERVCPRASPPRAFGDASRLRSRGLPPIRYSHIRSSVFHKARGALDGDESVGGARSSLEASLNGFRPAGDAAGNTAQSAACQRHDEQFHQQLFVTIPTAPLEWHLVLSHRGSRRCLVGLLLFLALSTPPYVPVPLASLQASSFSAQAAFAAPLPPPLLAAAAAAGENALTDAPDVSATPPARRSPSPRVVLPPPPYILPEEVVAERAAFEGRVDRAVRALEEGRRAQGEGRWADALALYTEVQEQYPDLALSVYGKAGRALMEYEVGDFQIAVTRLRVLSVEFKGYPEVHAALAAALYSEGGAAAAERQFTIATLLDRRYSDLAWLERERHWPPSLLQSMQRFLLLQ